MRRPRIVIAEDDEAIRELIKIRLDIAGYIPLTAKDGYEALEQIRNNDPAGLILDIGMPRLDGFGVLESLRSRGADRRLPTLILTARHSSQDVQRAISLGAADFIAKPFNDQLLLQRVARMLQAKKAEAASAAG